jgi:outer membrane biosynthesis protein TonB
MQARPENIAQSNGGREKRERPRRLVSVLTYVSVDDANGGVVVDISEMGMAISSAEPIGETGSHMLRFWLPRIERAFETSAELVWTSESKKNAGVRFNSLSVEDRLQIRNWIKDELFAEAFPSRAAVRTVPRRNLNLSYEALMTPNGAAGLSPGDADPLPSRKALTDLPVETADDKRSEFDRMFPSERALPAEPTKRVEKFAKLASITSIETTAYWMNFPSERATAADTASLLMGEPVETPAAPETEAKTESADSIVALPREIPAVEEFTLEEMVIEPEEVALVEAVSAVPSQPERVFEAETPKSSEAEAQTVGRMSAVELTPAVATESPAAEIAIEPEASEPVAALAPVEVETLTPETTSPALRNEIAIPEEMLAHAPAPADETALAIPDDDAIDLHVHELNPAMEGPQFAASRLDLIDISDAVKAPGKFSGGSGVSDASIESLLAIAAEEETTAPRAPKPLRMVPEKKFVASTTAATATAAAQKSGSATLPHVALRSTAQQSASSAPLDARDKNFGGLAIAASIMLLVLCFAIGYSSHFRPSWTKSTAPTSATDSAAPAPAVQPQPAPPDNSTSDPSKSAPTASKLPDSASVTPDANYKAAPLPTPAAPTSTFFPVTAPAEGSAPRMVELPETTVFDSPKVMVRLSQFFFVPAQSGPEWSHSLERISIGESTAKVPPAPAENSQPGVVKVRATIGKDGAVKDARPLSGPVSLIPRSLEAIRRWRYQPSALDGKPVEWQGNFTIEFRPAL